MDLLLLEDLVPLADLKEPDGHQAKKNENHSSEENVLGFFLHAIPSALMIFNTRLLPAALILISSSQQRSQRLV